MKKTFVTIGSLLASAGAVVFSFLSTGCYINVGSGGGGAVEYGVPYAEFEIKTKVVDQESNRPIPGIQVEVEIEHRRYDVEKKHYTDNLGEALFVGKMFANKTSEIEIKAKDVDGALNGIYQEAEVELVVRNSDFVGGKNWYQGRLTREVILKLRPQHPTP